ncbi:MAG: MOSC domain-containing protein [Rhodospirillales bacterium]|nr:MOSC domain-containing protein [Rhodospirillales bacterium]
MSRLESIWRYPVSSFAGERLAAAEIGPKGVIGDRVYGAVDLRDGDIARPGKKPHWDGTPGIAARIAGEAVEIRALEGGAASDAWLAAESDSAGTVLTAHFGFPVALRRHPAPGLGAGTPTVAPRYELRHIHLLSRQSLASLGRRVPETAIDERRFRPNLLVDLEGHAGDFPETDWPNGAEFTVGQARLRVVEPCRRCVFVTLRHGDQPRDPGVLRALAYHNNADLGTVCAVVTPGPVREGDAVRLG